MRAMKNEEDNSNIGLSHGLQVIHNKLAHKSTYDQKRNPYYLALNAPRLLEKNAEGKITNMGAAIINIGAMLTKVALDCGSIKSIEGNVKIKRDGREIIVSQLELLSTSLLTEVNLIFPLCTVEELRLALNNYVRGEYGEFKGGLAIVNFNHAIKCFIKSDARIKAKAEMKLPEPASREELDTIQLEQDYKEWIGKQFEKYKATGELEFIASNYQYQQMEGWGLIKLTKEEKEAMLPEARNQAYQNRKGERNIFRREKLKEINDLLRRFETNELIKSDKIEIQVEARRIAIKRYYDSITELPKF